MSSFSSKSILSISLLAWALVAPISQARADDSGKDPLDAAMNRLRARDVPGAIQLLERVDEDDEHYARAQAFLGHSIHARRDSTLDKGLACVDRAYAKAPDDLEVVLFYIWTHVKAGDVFRDDPTREHLKKIPPQLAYLAAKRELDIPAPSLSREKLEADLDYLEKRLVHCFSYLTRRKIDYLAGLDAIRASLEDETSVADFGLRLSMYLCLFGDAHSRLSVHPFSFVPRGFAPFIAKPHGERTYLMTERGDALLDADHPYLTEIDGQPLAKWLEVAGRLAPRGSPQLFRDVSHDFLGATRFLRGELGLPTKAKIRPTLESVDRSKTREMVVEVKQQPSASRRGRGSRVSSKRLGDVGYVKIPRMGVYSSFVNDLDDALHDLKSTKGLSIDVRDNSGSTQDGIKTFLPYLMRPDAPMKTVNVARYRIPLRAPEAQPGRVPRALRARTSSEYVDGLDRPTTKAD
jgi:hypothetical protein